MYMSIATRRVAEAIGGENDDDNALDCNVWDSRLLAAVLLLMRYRR
jgi:hypothetical protein